MKFLKYNLFFISIFLFQSILSAQEWVSYQSQQQINDLLEEGDELLLATDAGLVVMNKTTLEKEIFNKANTNLNNNHIQAISQSVNGDNWIGTYDVVIGRFDGVDIQEAITPESDFYDENTKLYDFKFAPNGDLWIGTTDGIFHKQGDTWLHYGEEELGTGLFDVWDIEINSSGDVFIGSIGIFKYSNEVWSDISEGTQISGYIGAEFFTTSTGDIFFGGDLDQIGRYDGEEWEEYDFEDFLPGFNGSELVGFTEDAAGNIYFNTLRDGIFKLENDIWTLFENVQTQEFENESDYFYIDEQDNYWLNKDIYLSVNSNGNLQSTTISDYTIESNSIANLSKDTNGNIYFFNYSNKNASVKEANGDWSFFALPPSAAQFENFNDIVFNAENDIWLASSEGLYHFDGTDWMFMDLESCKSFAVNGQGKIYALGIERIYIIENGIISEYNTANSPITAPFLSGHGVDAAGNLWIAAREINTIYKVSNDGNWTIFTDADHAAISNPTGDFHFDTAGNVWVSDTGVGAIKFDGTTWFNPFVGNFEEIENIDVESVESDATGKMYFAHHYGIVTLLNEEWENLNIEDIPLNLSHTADIKFDDAGTLWYANERYGVFSYTPQTMTTTFLEIKNTNKFTIYPNPVFDYFNFDFSIKEMANVRVFVYNSLGQLKSSLDLGTLSAGDYQQRINAANLPRGFYSVQLQINEKSYVETLILQ